MDKNVLERGGWGQRPLRGSPGEGGKGPFLQGRVDLSTAKANYPERVLFPPAAGGILLMVCALLMLCLPAAARDHGAPDDALLEELASRAAGIRGIESRFTQTRTLSFMNEKLVSHGSFTFRRPDTLVWRYESPAPFVLEYKNGTARFSDSFSGQSSGGAHEPQNSPLAVALARHILPWMTLDREALRAAYTITVKSRAPCILELTPKNAARGLGIVSMEVTFADRSSDVAVLVLREQDGDSVRLVFTDTRHLE